MSYGHITLLTIHVLQLAQLVIYGSPKHSCKCDDNIVQVQGVL